MNRPLNPPHSSLTDLEKIAFLQQEVDRLKAAEVQSRQYFMVLESMNVGTWDWVVPTGALTINARWAQIIGYTLEELQPISIATWEAYAHPDDLIKAQTALDLHFKGETKEYEIDLRMRHRDGHWVWIHDRGQIFERDAQGQVVRMIGTHTDITERLQLEQLRSNAQYHALIENAPFPIIISRISDESLRYGNKRAMDKFKFRDDQGVGLPTSQFYVHDADREAFLSQLRSLGYVYDMELELYNFEMQPYWALLSASFTHYEEEPCILITINDINDRKKVEIELRHEKEKYQLLADSMADVIWVYNATHHAIEYISPSVEALLGIKVEDATVLLLETTLTPESQVAFSDEVERQKQRLKKEGHPRLQFTQELQIRDFRGAIIWIENSARIYYNDQRELIVVNASRNIEERKQSEQRIEYINLHDGLTGLLNKTAFRLLEMDGQATHELGSRFSILYIDIDNFGIVNDTLGHRDGDEVIQAIANKIDQYVLGKGHVYHYDGDEFLILVNHNDPKPIEAMAKDLIRSVATQIRVQDREYILTASIGIALSQEGQTIARVFRNASTALYVAKQIRNIIRFYTEDMDHVQARETILEKDLGLAIERHELELYFQPIYDVRKGIINHAEALLRWNHPDFGLVMPADFIPIAERTKLIIPITDWVFKESCLAIQRFIAAGHDDIIVSMNVSLTALVNRSETLYNTISFTLLEMGLDPKHIKLEVTESSLLQDSVEIIRIFNLFKDLGVKLELDDFGTGYSSFGYLKSLPLDIVKIDRSLISNIETDPKEKMILESMVTILHGLDLEVVIEGVENINQFTRIVSLRPDYIQGYLFNRPLPEKVFLEYLEAAKDTRNLPVAYRIKNYPEFVLHWREEWNSGIEIVDTQHQDLMKAAAHIERNRLGNLLEAGIDAAFFEHLIQSIEQHFKDEEAIIRSKDYPYAKQHSEEHERLILQARKLQSMESKDRSQSDAFITFIVRDLILDHIINDDAHFFPFLRNNQLGNTSFPSLESITEEVDFNDASHYQRLLKENIQLQNLLSDISHIFVQVDILDFDQKVKEALKRVALQVDVDRAYIFTYDWDKNTCSNTYEYCRDGILPQIDQLQDIPVDAIPDWIHAHTQGKAINIYDVKSLPLGSNLREMLEPQDILSLLTVPMMAGDSCYGFIGFDSVLRHHMYSEFERSILQEVSNVILVALKRKASEDQLMREKDLYETAVSSLVEGLVVLDSRLNVSYVNPMAKVILELKDRPVLGVSIRDLCLVIDFDTNAPLFFDWERYHNQSLSMVLKPNVGLITEDGTQRRIAGRVTPIRSSRGDFQGTMIHIKDITLEYENKAQMEAFLNINLDMLCVADLDGYFRQVNQRFTDILGYSIEELNGQLFYDLIHPEDLASTREVMKDLPITKILHGFTNRYRHKDGSYRYLEWNAQLGLGRLLYASAKDITGQRLSEAQNEYNSYHDALTDLYNRRYLEEVFKNIEIDRRIHPISVLMCDLDELKTINDELGHAVGDEFIRETAQQLRRACRPEDIIGRWGGDEFIVILPKTNADQAAKIAQRIQKYIHNVPHIQHDLSLSIGLSTKTDEGMGFPDVLRQADERMYHQKRLNKKQR